jgi:acyl-coenzyme A thioesterase PaaI-like protein
MKQLRDVDAAGSVTLGIETQFIGAGDPSKPLDAVVQVLRETRRLGFLRGLVEQDDALVASFSATIRKPTSRA